MSFQLVRAFLKRCERKKPQAEGSLYCPVYLINSEVQWAFSLSFFLNDVKGKKPQTEGSLYCPVYSVNSEVQ